MSNGSAQNLNSIQLSFQREDVVTEHEAAFVCSLCYLSRPLNVCVWHEADMPTASRDVRFRGQSGKHLLAMSFSGFDPNRKSRL
jgi:hypothetical protein